MTDSTPLIHQCTPVRIVEDVEPSVEFWTSRFGFEKTGEVPGDDGKLVFAMLNNGVVELMYQTRRSVIADEPEELRDAKKRELEGDSTVLFMQVGDIADVERRLQGAEIVKPRHDTFYGMTEIYAREPGGGLVGFAAVTVQAS